MRPKNGRSTDGGGSGLKFFKFYFNMEPRLNSNSKAFYIAPIYCASYWYTEGLVEKNPDSIARETMLAYRTLGRPYGMYVM